MTMMMMMTNNNDNDDDESPNGFIFFLKSWWSFTKFLRVSLRWPQKLSVFADKVVGRRKKQLLCYARGMLVWVEFLVFSEISQLLFSHQKHGQHPPLCNFFSFTKKMTSKSVWKACWCEMFMKTKVGWCPNNLIKIKF